MAVRLLPRCFFVDVHHQLNRHIHTLHLLRERRADQPRLLLLLTVFKATRNVRQQETRYRQLNLVLRLNLFNLYIEGCY